MICTDDPTKHSAFRGGLPLLSQRVYRPIVTSGVLVRFDSHSGSIVPRASGSSLSLSLRPRKRFTRPPLSPIRTRVCTLFICARDHQ
jgi:hypothetical protein